MKICTRCAELFPDDASFCPHDGTSLEKSRDRFLGRTIAARYKLIRRLGSGGMSVVYLARHEVIARLSALKILRPELSLVTEHRERFLREARAVNRINHPNIVEITDVGESDGVAYLVMEYVEGDSLLTHIQRGRLAWERALRIGVQLASALARAHQAGVVHRDLKPENILLVPSKEGGGELAKLTDFGIAKMSGEPSLTLNEQLFGTPGYIAPEYVGGIGIDGRSDIYSLAVVIYEMVTGTLPFEGKGQSELLLKPLTSAPIPPSKRIDTLPPDLESLLLRALARDPAERPHDAFAMHDALADIVRRFGAAVRTPSTPVIEGEAEAAREPIETIIDRVSAAPGEAREAASVGRMETGEMSSRWSTALADLEAHIARARQKGGPHARAAARAAELALVASEMIPRVERAGYLVGELQAKVDRLEATGREFRGNLGHALDVLVHDRSRERAHLDALRARRQALERAAAAGVPPAAPPSSSDAPFGPSPAPSGWTSGTPSSGAPSGPTGTVVLTPIRVPSSAAAPAPPPPPSAAGVDPRAWEIEALRHGEERAEGGVRDYDFQIETLQRRLDNRNEAFERELVQATGSLEGSLSALRRLTSEIVRTIDDGIDILQRSG
jgi:serine/threonine-protein kinase